MKIEPPHDIAWCLSIDQQIATGVVYNVYVSVDLYLLLLGFTCTHKTIRLLLHGKSSWSKADTRPFKAVAVLTSFELRLNQLRQFFLSCLLPSCFEPCHMCLKGLWRKKVLYSSSSSSSLSSSTAPQLPP